MYFLSLLLDNVDLNSHRHLGPADFHRKKNDQTIKKPPFHHRTLQVFFVGNKLGRVDTNCSTDVALHCHPQAASLYRHDSRITCCNEDWLQLPGL